MSRPTKPPRPQVVWGIGSAPPEQQANCIWEPQPGPQTEVLKRQEFEVFYGGAKGSGKSYLGIGWLIWGNYFLPSNPSPTDVTYINNPNYRALAIRRNLIDLHSWMMEARRVYEPMGAEMMHTPLGFRFPSGAQIVLGHLSDADAAYKYFGNVVHRAFVDELTFIPTLSMYLQLLSCVRSTITDIRPQLLLTGNPGGPGHNWVQERFITPESKDGQRIPPGTTISEESFNPFLKRKVSVTRVFIQAKIDDNKKLVESDPLYYNRLMILPDAEREAYLFGNWDAFSGIYFNTFRSVRRQHEDENAVHVIKKGSRVLAPWWNRWIGGDWGYRHANAIFWACQDPNGQVIIYDEIVSPGVSAIELGADIARRSLSTLEGLEDHTMTLYFSPDAFQVRDEVNTQAEQLILGMRRVLGPDCAYIATDSETTGARTMERIQSSRRATIVLRQAQNARVSGWQYMREMMRWKALPKPDKDTLDRSYAAALYRDDLDKYKQYVSAFDEKSELVLPKLLFMDNCTNAIRAIPTASYKPNTEDVLKTDAVEDDVLDGLRYTIAAHQSQKLREPFQVFYARKMEEITAAHPNDMDGQMKMQVAMRLESAFDEQYPSIDGFTARSSSRQGRMRDFVQ